MRIPLERLTFTGVRRARGDDGTVLRSRRGRRVSSDEAALTVSSDDLPTSRGGHA